jgi:hypothetical protein
MAKTSSVALAQTVFHNKESLVLIRSVKRGLVLHFLFFKNEIRDFDAIAKGEGIKLPSEQLGSSISGQNVLFGPWRVGLYRNRFGNAKVNRSLPAATVTNCSPADR